MDVAELTIYDLWKPAVAGLRIYYVQELPNGLPAYYAVGSRRGLVLANFIISSADVADFEANVKPFAVSSPSRSDAVAAALLAGAFAEELPSDGRRMLLGYTFGQADTTVDAQFWTTTISGSGTFVQSAGLGTLATGATAGSTATAQTTFVARVVLGAPSLYSAEIALSDTGVAGNTRAWGVFDVTNGYLFNLNGALFKFAARRGGVDTLYAVPFTPDTNFHRYEILYTPMSVLAFIDSRLVLVLPPDRAAPLTNNDNLPARIANANLSGVSASVSLSCRSVAVSTFGSLDRRARFMHLAASGTAVVKRGPTTLRRVVVNQTAVTATLTLYDNTAASGAIVATISTNSIGSYEFNLDTNIGLTAVITGSPDVTIVFD